MIAEFRIHPLALLFYSLVLFFAGILLLVDAFLLKKQTSHRTSKIMKALIILFLAWLAAAISVWLVLAVSLLVRS